MNIEDQIKIESIRMFDCYVPYYIKHYHYKRNKFSIQKDMKYFEAAARLFCVREGYDAKKLIDAFMLDGFKFPAQLPYESVWKRYIDYSPGLSSNKSKEVEIVESIVSAAMELKRVGTVKDWLNKKLNQRAVETNQMRFSPLLFAFSDAFNNFCRGEYYNLTELRNKVFVLPSKDKIIDKIKSILGEDFYD